MFGKRGGSTCMHGLPTNRIVEENAKTASEERTSWDLTCAGNPER